MTAKDSSAGVTPGNFDATSPEYNATKTSSQRMDMAHRLLINGKPNREPMCRLSKDLSADTTGPSISTHMARSLPCPLHQRQTTRPPLWHL